MSVPPPTQLWSTSFALYLMGLASTALADAILFVALPFAVLTFGGTHQEVALVVLCGSLPRFAALFLGVLADRWPAHRVLTLTAAVRTLLVLVVGLAVLRLYANVAVLATFALVNSLLVTFTVSAGSVLVPRLVPPDRLVQGNSLVMGATLGLPLVGYGLGGLLVKVVGSAETLLVAAPLYLVMVLAAAFLRVHAEVRPTTQRPSYQRDLKEGWTVSRANPVLLYTLALTFMLNLTLNVVNVRAPLFATTAGRGASDYALFEGLYAGGALLGILAVGLCSRWWSVHTQIGVALTIFTLGILTLSVPDWTVWFLAASVYGLGMGMLDVASLTLMQLLVPDGLRGRLTGISITTGALGLSLGAGLAGLATATSELMLVLGIGLVTLALSWIRRRNLAAPLG